ncbi:transposase [Ectopseudomonas oleovorans]|uniref:Transposase n=2 Tax=Ectopseudomonas oleovorans TaxID=301 RepID=A0AA42TXT6_ECTOL|nr:transposase [Pseudomonas oleovorans]MDH1340231.1 transposase [Pseudomonas oleovorans]MDH1494044.1 transposase [Pseudomonas oleovorans]
MDARKLSPQEQREKRSMALRMREQGYTYKAIGEAVGVHPRTIAHWAQVAEHKGEKAAIAGGQRGVRQGDRRSLSSSQEVLIRFLSRLIRDAQGRKVFLILDNLRVHHSKKVSAWVGDRKEQIELFFLPAYAPELNPDEYLNCDLKHQVRPGLPARNQDELEGRVRSVMRRLQLRPQRILSYFRHPRIAYAA